MSRGNLIFPQHIQIFILHWQSMTLLYTKSELLFSIVIRKEDISDAHHKSAVTSFTLNKNHPDKGKLLPITGSKL